jgi:hypothetical protein
MAVSVSGSTVGMAVSVSGSTVGMAVSVSGSTVGMAVQWVWQCLCYKAVSSVTANLNSFTGSNKNYKGKQKDPFGMCILQSATILMQYKITNLL